MGFSNLEDIARRKKERIEQLLLELGGKVRRASELPVPREVSTGLSLDELLPDASPIEGYEGIRCRVSRVAIGATEKPTHPRGYVFQPVPNWKLLQGAMVEPESLAVLAPGWDVGEKAVALERFVFLDTETTGLATNAGTYAFLVGLGYFGVEWPPGAQSPLRASFVCEQYFMEDVHYEPALLELVAARLRAFDVLVTFNGQNYDVPLLESRSILNRMRLSLQQVHVDLLLLARRIWRRLQSRSLASLESNILGVTRTHDILGCEIPGIYFNHLRGIERERLLLVFDHNVQDIVSSGALFLHLVELLRDPAHERLVHGQDAFGIGSLHLERGMEELAFKFFLRAIDLGVDGECVPKVKRVMLRLYRRTGAYVDGASFLAFLVKKWGRRYPELYCDLARWYERYLCDFQQALWVIEDAERQARFERDLGLGNSQRRLAWDRVLVDLAARRRRIEKKLGIEKRW